MSFFNEVAILFQGMSWLAWLLIVLGLALVITELFRPCFGIFGTVGGLLIVLAVLLRISKGDGNIYAQIFTIAFIVSIVIIVAFIVLIMTAKRGWVLRSPLLEKSKEQEKEDHEDLQDQYGVALTDIKPIGKANVGGQVVDVISEGFYVDKGELIIVTDSKEGKIKVERLEN